MGKRGMFFSFKYMDQEDAVTTLYLEVYGRNSMDLEVASLFQNNQFWGDFPGGPVVKTLCFQCRGCRFHLWSGN